MKINPKAKSRKIMLAISVISIVLKINKNINNKYKISITDIVAYKTPQKA